MGELNYTTGGDSNLVSFRSAARVPITSLKAEFLPVQEGEGDPSPENIREISGWNSYNVYQTGKNLFNINAPFANPSSTLFSNTTKRIFTPFTFCKGISEGNYWDPTKIDACTIENNTLTVTSKAGYGVGYVIPVIPNVDYYFKTNSTGTYGNYIIIYKKDGTFLQNLSGVGKKTMPADAAIAILMGRGYAAGTTFSWTNIQIEIASNATEYEPYNGQTISVKFPIIGKNKFNINASFQNPNNTANINTTKRIFSPYTYCVGGSYSNFFYPSNIENYSVENNTITVKRKSGSSVYGVSYALPLISGRTYYLSCTAVSGFIHTAFYDKEGNYLKGSSNNYSNFSFTVPEKSVISLFNFIPENTTATATFTNIQIEEGNTATAYVAYDSNNTVYGGYVDIAKGELIKTWEKINLSELTWIYDSSNHAFYTSDIMYKIWKNGVTMYCNTYTIDNKYVDQLNSNAISSANSYGSGKIFIKTFDYTTVNDLIDSLSDTYLIYPLRSTVYSTYLLSKIELKTLLDQNNIWSNTNSSTEVSYVAYDSAMIRGIKQQMILHSQPKLQYWLCGDDAPVNGKWIERIHKLPFTLYNGADWDSENSRYNFDTLSKGAALDRGPNANNFYIGHHWQFDFDVWINRGSSKETLVFFDIGSVTQANKALGIGAGPISDTPTSAGILNWKLHGNSSSPFSGTQIFHPSYPIVPKNEFVHLIGSYKLVSGNDGYDRLIATVNGVTFKFDTIHIPKAVYGPTWNTDKLCVGTSVYSYNSLINNSSYSGYSPCCYIKDIKIYILD